MTDRKQEEAKFHDMLRDPALAQNQQLHARLTANRKYYSVARKSRQFYERWLIEHSAGRRVLEYGCGNGQLSLLAAKHGAETVGVDISEVSVENARREAARQGLADRARFHVMDCEALQLEDNSFDVVCESGVLHHLDLRKAMPEIARVVKPGGYVICAEALRHNPIIQLYRRLTPQLRTAWETEHILRRGDILVAKRWFGRIEMRFFHLASLAAVPLRETPLFRPVLSALEFVDDFVLRLPLIKWQAWQVVYVLSEPKKR